MLISKGNIKICFFLIPFYFFPLAWMQRCNETWMNYWLLITCFELMMVKCCSVGYIRSARESGVVIYSIPPACPNAVYMPRLMRSSVDPQQVFGIQPSCQTSPPFFAPVMLFSYVIFALLHNGQFVLPWISLCLQGCGTSCGKCDCSGVKGVKVRCFSSSHSFQMWLSNDRVHLGSS